MLNGAFKLNKIYSSLVMHSGQGRQYQHQMFRECLQRHGVKQSMSRKGNSNDNGMMESFFGTLKSEMFYGEETTFKDIHEFKRAIEEYIEYYNHKRIKSKLKGLSPVQYRNQILQIN